MPQAQEQTQAPVQNKPTIGQFGEGRYSKVASELFKDSQRLLNVTEAQADKIARAFMSDLGRLQSKVDSVALGKLSKSGITLREISKVKLTNLSYSLTIAKLCTMLDEARNYGVTKFDKITLFKDLGEWVEQE